MSRAPTPISGTPVPSRGRLPTGPMLDVSPSATRVTMEGMGLRPVFITGLALILVFFGGFGTWAALAPLETAAIASGRVVVGSNVKVVQHLEGGIVSKILVAEGSVVKEGDPVVLLDETQPGSTLGVMQSRARHGAAREARLVAERDKLPQIKFPAWLLAEAKDPEVAEIIGAQQRIFQSRREALASQTSILRQRVAQYKEEISGLEAEIVAETKQLELIQQELRDVQFLLEKGLERRPRFLALQRQAADIEGSRARNRSTIARSKQAIGETELRIVDLVTTQNAEVAKELREVQAEFADVLQQRRAAEDVMKRTVIRAPVSGTVVKLKFHTTGGVVAPREPLMEIVPVADTLVVEAQVSPNDIDIVHAGLRAQVRLTAFSTRSTPILDGEVETISADRLVDERTGMPYYSARIIFSDEQEQKVQDVQLYPGMPAEVMIVAGERTPLSYLIKPFSDSFSRAIRED